MIKASNIFKKYGDVEILKGISLHIKESEVVSIVGASGAGKSTLLHILGTLDKAENGNLSINNTPISSLNANELAKFRNATIGFVFQFHYLLPEFTALENVIIPASIYNTKNDMIEKKAKELLSYFGLSHRLNHKPSQMSGGEQQRVAVARALINTPKVIFADEPSGNLDSNNAKELHQLFFQLRKDFNQTFVIVTHNESLADMSDRKILLTDGRISN
jgi:lipoprotein-releasing system ATP-binding protein